MLSWFFGGIIDAVMGALPLVAVVGSIALAIGAVFASTLIRLPMLAGSFVLALFAAYLFGGNAARNDSKEAGLRIELATVKLDLAAAENSVKYWTDQAKEQETERLALESKVTDYELELSKPDAEPVKPVGGVCPNVCGLKQRDIDRLYGVGR